MKSFTTFVNETYDFSSVQVKIPDNIAIEMIAMGNEISQQDIAEDGRDSRPHITVKYGLHSSGPEELAKIGFPRQVKARMGKVSMFSNENVNVLKVDISSPDLEYMNKDITNNTKNTTTFPDYHPHSTIAYLKPGKGEEFVGDTRFEGREIVFDVIEFSSKDDDEYQQIKLG